MRAIFTQTGSITAPKPHSPSVYWNKQDPMQGTEADSADRLTFTALVCAGCGRVVHKSRQGDDASPSTSHGTASILTASVLSFHGNGKPLPVSVNVVPPSTDPTGGMTAVIFGNSAALAIAINKHMHTTTTLAVIVR